MKFDAIFKWSLKADILSKLRKGADTIHLSLIHIDNRKIDNRSVVVPVDQLAKRERKKLFEGLPLALKNGADIISSDHNKETERYAKKLPDKQESELISFFENKVPLNDLYALKASIYIKKIFDSGGDVKPLKQSLRLRLGQRAVNISNLYSARYFETWIKPMYENMSKKEDFLEAYNLIVEKAPFAVFVSFQMGVNDIKSRVKEKIKDSRKYGIKECNIHGIGAENIFNITTAVNELRKEMNLMVDFEERGGFFVAKLDLSKVKN